MTNHDDHNNNDVDIDVIGDDECQITSYMNSTSPSSFGSTSNNARSYGTMFSVTALQDIEILTFEFAHFDAIRSSGGSGSSSGGRNENMNKVCSIHT